MGYGSPVSTRFRSIRNSTTGDYVDPGREHRLRIPLPGGALENDSLGMGRWEQS
jgi:hypothetical protein